MENRIQPILCCVGADVAGEPTQFLMERAALAGHLDWHVITVDVTPEQLPVAWQGMDVMRFQAVRFFAAHQTAAMHLVKEPSSVDLFIGGITSAMRSGDTWQMWHNAGPALVELLASRLAWTDTVCWVHGHNMRTRSFLAACQSRPPKKIYWTGISTPEASDPASNSDSHLPDALSSLPLVVGTANIETEIAALTAESTGTTRALVHVGDPAARNLEFLLECQPGFECSLAVVSGAPGSRRKLTEAWRAGDVLVLTPADLVVAEEAYDQARWTGQSVNVDLLREAYEEYADF